MEGKPVTLFSKVTRRMWRDEVFRGWSAPGPNAQTLWFRLLTGPELTCIPGLFPAYDVQLAKALGWPLEGFREAFLEIQGSLRARADWEAGLVWVPGAIKHNRPQSTNVVKSWRSAFDELPECQLKNEALEELRVFSKDLSKAFQEAFAKAFPEESEKHPVSKKQEQEQDTATAVGEHPRHPESQTGRLPSSMEEAFAIPVQRRCELIEANTHAADWLTPHRWPELIAVAKASNDARGRGDPRLLSYAKSEDVQQLVALYASGITQEELERAVRSEFWRKSNLGLRSLTTNIVERAQGGEPEAEPSTEWEGADQWSA